MSLELRTGVTPKLLRRARAAAKRAISDAIDAGASNIAVRQVDALPGEDMRLSVTSDVGSHVVVIGGP